MGKARRVVQLLWAALSNSFVTGFLAGKIYRGDLKKLCAPGLNCYSCPGALLSCPIGALQAVIGSRAFNASLYVMGFLLIVGSFLGRAVCGFLCPFGLIQELIYKIPFPKKRNAFKLDKALRYGKYLTLAVLVILLPLLLTDLTGNAAPYFCKLVCPAGTLEGGIPLMLLGRGYAQQAGALFGRKLAVLIATLLSCLIVYRPFCKYLCPLGAIYGLLSPIALCRLRIDQNLCVHCGVCKRVCKMGVSMPEKINSPECVHCGDCVKACPVGALHYGFPSKRKRGMLG